MKRIRIPLLARIVVAIALGILFGSVLPEPLVRLFATFNALFSQYLQFLIPLIIVGLVAPAIADIGKSAGRLLVVTALIAYADTVCSGLISYGVGAGLFPQLIVPGQPMEQVAAAAEIKPFFTVEIPALMSVMTALVLAFTLGLGIAHLRKQALKSVADEFRDVVVLTIERTIIPLLPLYILGIFLSMTHSGQVVHVLSVFIKVIGIIFALHVLLLVLQYVVAGAVARINPLRALWRMMPAYFTALGTSSSAATIPVTLRRVEANGVTPGIAGFVVPLCATIHLSGSTLKIVACALALMIMQGMAYDFTLFAGFILMLGIIMVAAPGVPGGAIMAALGVLQSMLGFGEQEQALMIALYITMDSFGTACNVTGDGAIALVVDTLFRKRRACVPSAENH